MSVAKNRERPSLTVDIVLLAPIEGMVRVLLVKRRKDPFAGCWALPGGFVDPHEALESAARRELQEETGVNVPRVHQLRTFGDPGRDPRGWTVSVAFVGLLEEDEARALHIQASSDAIDVQWFDLLDLPPLAFDHARIVTYAAHVEAGDRSCLLPEY